MAYFPNSLRHVGLIGECIVGVAAQCRDRRFCCIVLNIGKYATPLWIVKERKIICLEIW